MNLDKETYALMWGHTENCFRESAQWAAAGRAYAGVLPYWPLSPRTAIPHDILPVTDGCASFAVKYWAGTRELAAHLRDQLTEAFKVKTWSNGKRDQLHGLGYIEVEDGAIITVIVILSAPDGLLFD